MRGRNSTSGFTLLELITTMSIAAILMGIAIPSFRYVTTSNRMASEVNSLLGDMQYARVEAIKEGQPVSVCVANSAGTDCQTGAAPWTGGWIVFSDPNGDGALAAQTDILRYRPSLPTSNSSDTFVSPASVVTFNREGFASGLAASPTLFTLHNVTADAAFSRCLSLTPTGYLIVVARGVGGCS